ncbi:MAG: hypothetical protein U0746_17060 [Gemmataceae bacterium]
MKLGMTRQAVHDVLGKPEWSRNEREAFLGGFFVDFDKSGCVEFIELAKSEHFKALFEGECLHQLPADDAVRLVSKFDKHDETDREVGYSYIFLKLQMSLWRGTMPQQDQNEDDNGGRYFEAVGVASPGYFEAGK